MTRRRDSGGSAREQPSAGPAPSSLGIAALGVTDSAFTNLARHAVSLVLDSVREVLNDVETFSEALTGAGAFVCGHLDLPASFAPFVEAEAARLVAAVPASRLSTLALPAIVAAIDQQPLDVQHALVDDAAARLAPPPEPRAAQRRAVAARAKTTGYVGPASTPGMPGTAVRTAVPVSRPVPTPLDVRHARITGTGPIRTARAPAADASPP